MRVRCDFCGGVVGTHVDDPGVFAHLRPFGFYDALEVFRVTGEHVLVDLEEDGGAGLAGFYGYDFAREAGRDGLDLGFGWGRGCQGWREVEGVMRI
jgi:hypothetical protein